MTATSPTNRRIIGIDPGSRLTGFGVIETDNAQQHYLTSGVIRTGEGPIPQRLKTIVDGIVQVIEQYQPDEMAIEQVFMARNADSALKLGQARGAAIAAAVFRDLPVFEYSAKQVKQAAVGTGGAKKEQVQHMVKVLLGLSGNLQEDAADALAVAICHHHTQASVAQLDATRVRNRRWQ